MVIYDLQALPAFPPAPADWPPLVVEAGPAVNRSGVMTEPEDVPEEVQVNLVQPLDIATDLAAGREVGDDGDSLDTIAVLLIVIVALLAATLAGVLWWCVGARRRKAERGAGAKVAGFTGTSDGGSGGLPALGGDVTTVRVHLLHA